MENLPLNFLAEKVTNGIQHGDQNKEENDDGTPPVAED
jgi:hypothetical protein